VDGDLVEVVAVDGLHIEGVEELLDEARRRVAEDVSEDGQGIQEGGVVVLGGGRVQGGELGFDPGPFGEQLSETGTDPVAESLGGRVARLGGCLQFGDKGVFGGVDTGELLAERGGLGLPLGGLVGGAGGESGGEHGGAVGTEHSFTKESGQGSHQVVFPDGHGWVIGVGGGVARDGPVVRAPVVGVGRAVGRAAAGNAAHPAAADFAPEAGAELVAAAGSGGGGFGVPGGAVLGSGVLGGVPGGLVHEGVVGGLG